MATILPSRARPAMPWSARHAGDDPPLLLVHGLSGNWQNWLENLPRLARERRVVALDLPGFGQSEDPRDEISMPGYGRAEKRMAFVRPRIRHLVYSTIMRHPSLIAPETLWEMSEGAGRSAFGAALEAILDYDFRDRLGEIRSPTLVVWGRDDMLVPVKDAAEYERQIRGARKVVLDDTGHVPMIERPRTVNRALIEFASEPRR